MLDKAKVLLVCSGKGGVGKSVIATNLAVVLSKKKKVGLLDCDTCPSVAKLLGMENASLKVDETGNKVIPPSYDKNLKVLSLGSDAPQKQHIAWKGEFVRHMVDEFINVVDWGNISYLVVDMPPGTSDELIEIMRLFAKQSKAVVITAPAQLSTLDAGRMLSMVIQHEIPVIGVIENFSGWLGDGGGQKLAKEFGVKLLGKIPYNKKIVASCDNGKPNLYELSKEFKTIVKKVEGGM